METIGIIAAILILIAYAVFLGAERAARGAVDPRGPSASLDPSTGTRAGFWRRLHLDPDLGRLRRALDHAGEPSSREQRSALGRG